MMKLLTWLMLILLMAGCSDSHQAETTTDCQDHPEYHIGRYTSSSWGFDTNSYWIEGPDGVILIDTQFLPSAANEAVDIAESYTGKKVVLAIVLHANPDKFNGTATLKARGIRVVSSKQVVDLIPAVDKKRREWFYDRYKPDYPDKLVLPDVAWDRTQLFEAAGLTLKAYLVGAAVSDAHVLIEFEDHLFVGDVIANKYHGWLELGKSKEWLQMLEEIRQHTHHGVIHPGRGYAMNGDTLLDRQEDYLRFVRTAIGERYSGGKITEPDKKAIIKRITEHYPDYGFEYFLNLGVPAEWERMRRDDHIMMR